MAAGKSRRQKGLTLRQRVMFGVLFVLLGANQLLLITRLAGHVLNLVAGLGLLTIGCLHLIIAAAQLHRERENSSRY